MNTSLSNTVQAYRRIPSWLHGVKALIPPTGRSHQVGHIRPHENNKKAKDNKPLMQFLCGLRKTCRI